jgi:hypothetical protein
MVTGWPHEMKDLEFKRMAVVDLHDRRSHRCRVRARLEQREATHGGGPGHQLRLSHLAGGIALEPWTVEAFVEALATPADQMLVQRLLDLATAAEGPGHRGPLWFGTKPGGGIYLHPGGVTKAPAWISFNSRDQLTSPNKLCSLTT